MNDFEDEGYNFNHIAEKNIILILKKRGMSYDFYIKHNMCALDWKLNAMINETKNLKKIFDRNWRHPSHCKFETDRVWSFYQIPKLTIKIYNNLSNIKLHFYLKNRTPIMRRHFLKYFLKILNMYKLNVR